MPNDLVPGHKYYITSLQYKQKINIEEPYKCVAVMKLSIYNHNVEATKMSNTVCLNTYHLKFSE